MIVGWFKKKKPPMLEEKNGGSATAEIKLAKEHLTRAEEVLDRIKREREALRGQVRES